MAGSSSPCVQFVDNKVGTAEGWLPCEPYHKGGPVVSCCKEIAGKTLGDVCLDYGLCYHSSNQSYYQGSCTDSTYEDALCPHLCNDQPFPNVIWNTTLQDWQCCGVNSNGQLSCNAPTTDEFFDAPAPSLLSTTATAGQTTSAASEESATRVAVTATKNPTISPTTSAPASSSGLSTGAEAGIGAGAGGGALVIIGILVWFLLRRRKRKRDSPISEASVHDSPPGMDAQTQRFQQEYNQALKYGNVHTPPPMSAPPIEAGSTSRVELAMPGQESYCDNRKGPKMNPLSNEHAPQELSNESAPQELPSNQPWFSGPQP